MKSTAKVFAVLETLCRDGAAGVSELSQRLDINKSSMHRFLSVLTDLGYARKEKASGKYRASLKVFQLGVCVRNRHSLITVLRPFMEQLSRDCEATVNMALFVDDAVTVMDRVEGLETLRTNIELGSRLPAYCTAFGKVFLAHLSPEDLKAYLERQPLSPRTHRTIVTAAALKAELERVRRDGFAMDNQELNDLIRCVAAPVRDDSNQVVAAMSISGPAASMTLERVARIRPVLVDTTARASLELGWQPARLERSA